MFLKKKIAAMAMTALGAWLASGAAALAEQSHNWQLDMQPGATPVMNGEGQIMGIVGFHHMMLWIITAVSLFVLVLLLWVIVRFNAKANPVPAKFSHNTFIEILWTALPVLILLGIAIPSFRLLYFEMTIPQPDLTIRAIGKQWYWTYNYPVQKLQFDSLMLKDEDAVKAGEPRLLGVDNAIVVPVNKVVEIDTVGADVIHSWAVPAFGVKMDAVPGRINRTWFKATRTGTFYGECSELCGANHDAMPIEVKVVTDAQYKAWLAGPAKKFAATDASGAATQLASTAQ